MDNKMLTAKEVADKLGMHYISVYKRFVSKYAEERWGVVSITLRDGTTKKFLPSNNLYLWTENHNYLGRPSQL